MPCPPADLDAPTSRSNPGTRGLEAPSSHTPTARRPRGRPPPPAAGDLEAEPAAGREGGLEARFGPPSPGAGYAICRAGPACRMASEASARYFSKLSANIRASSSAFES